MVRTQGTSPQLYACMGGKAKRRQPNLWPYGWSLLVVGLEIKQVGSDTKTDVGQPHYFNRTIKQQWNQD